MVIGNLKRAIEEEDVWIPSDVMLGELRTYVSAENGSTNALPGNYDDTVMALAIAFEAYRTHQHRLTDDNISWKDKVGHLVEENTQWL